MVVRPGMSTKHHVAPLAIVVLGGLVTSTLLNMLVVPAGYLSFCTSVDMKEKDPERVSLMGDD